MANIIQIAILLIGVTLVVSQQDCKYFCKNPATHQYICCDDGNPFNKPTEDKTTDSSSTEDNVGAIVTEGESTGCYYYCAYGGSVYCCHEAGKPMPPNHDENEGRCASVSEQTCKTGSVLLGGKAFVKGDTMVLGSANDEVCASDGYCKEDEKCCINSCAKKHTCLKALFD